ncbi:general transcription factor II-I repeat domain-containing protein 2-like [Homarus americanus]|uniref:general transcription factor II-I repeat domain-containing protein 2-like n=1 Tax=Homarus americanus TaxID=6706 RepID=UPI001C466AE4|nr:general transcription factor II-I repeat domain-containing protein 2-like [Homarus americanus]
MNGKPTCLICNQQVAVAKEYNVQRPYETNHAMKYNKYSGKLREDKVKELEQSLKKQRSIFKSFHQVSDAAVKASYRIAHEIAVSSKPFSEGNYIKKYTLMASEDICPEKRQAFANISLSRNTVAERIGELSENINSQLKDKVKSFTAFSVTIDESTDVSDVAQLAVFIRGVDENMQVTEEFVKLVPVKGTTTGEDIFVGLVGALDKLGVDWAQTVSLATDGAPQMMGRKADVATKLKEKLRAVNPNHQIYNVHCIIHKEVLCSKTLKMDKVMDVVIKTVNFIHAQGLNHRQFNCLLEENENTHGLPYHTDVRWLRRGVVLKRFYELRSEIQMFMEQKGRDLHELKDNEWVQDLTFMVDITEHLYYVNTKMQGRNKLVTEFYDCIRAFEMKLQLFERQL